MTWQSNLVLKLSGARLTMNRRAKRRCKSISCARTRFKAVICLGKTRICAVRRRFTNEVRNGRALFAAAHPVDRCPLANHLTKTALENSESYMHAFLGSLRASRSIARLLQSARSPLLCVRTQRSPLQAQATRRARLRWRA